MIHENLDEIITVFSLLGESHLFSAIFTHLVTSYPFEGQRFIALDHVGCNHHVSIKTD